jgi:hypothetical protein
VKRKVKNNYTESNKSKAESLIHAIYLNQDFHKACTERSECIYKMNKIFSCLNVYLYDLCDSIDFFSTNYTNFHKLFIILNHNNHKNQSSDYFLNTKVHKGYSQRFTKKKSVQISSIRVICVLKNLVNLKNLGSDKKLHICIFKLNINNNQLNLSDIEQTNHLVEVKNSSLDKFFSTKTQCTTVYTEKKSRRDEIFITAGERSVAWGSKENTRRLRGKPAMTAENSGLPRSSYLTARNDEAEKKAKASSLRCDTFGMTDKRRGCNSGLSSSKMQTVIPNSVRKLKK